MQLSVLRRLFHSCGSVIPVTYLLWGQEAALTLTIAIFVPLLIADVVRVTTSFDSPFLRKHLKEKELKKPTASILYMISCLAVILLFDKLTATAAIFALTIADPLSSIVGSKWGKPRFWGKSAEGTTAFFLSSLLIMICFPFGIFAAFVAALAATATEALSSRFVDDNLTIPIVTAIVIAIVR